MIAEFPVQEIVKHPALPSNHDLVFYFHLNQSEDRVSWATILDNCTLLFGADNKKVVIAVVRRNIQDERLKSLRLSADIEKRWLGRVLLVCLEVQRKVGSTDLHWRKENSRWFPRVEEFMKS